MVMDEGEGTKGVASTESWVVDETRTREGFDGTAEEKRAMERWLSQEAKKNR